MLVSSDSDFTTLARRIHESGCRVYGVGGTEDPQPLVAACDEFLHLENLTAAPRSTRSPQEPAPPASPQSVTAARTAAVDVPPHVATRLREVVEQAAADGDGWTRSTGTSSKNSLS
ncbi:NYN domain-containing protein [Nocardia sp. CA-107356]|uniref:NYN domain-containing protein n=1 Tax=Nocardia sp. CA-107356 TaxID=3239972 RepID=UPI003D8A5468